MATFTTTHINGNYLIKVYGVDNGVKVNKLVGVSGALELIGREFLDKFINRAENSGLDKTVCKLRRGLVVTLYAK